MPEAEQINVARARWRADLLKLHAAELERIIGGDSSPFSANILADAQAKKDEADLHETAAQLEAELDAAKSAAFDDPKDAKKNKAYQQAAEELTEMRKTWRGIGEAVGNRRAVASVDNFEEPSDEEVLASHGGVA